MEAESLLHLVRTLIWAAGNPAAPSDDEDTALFCLEQVVAVTLRNRDRLALLWPLVYEHSADIMQGASVPGPLVERAVIGLIRVCQRLLPYKGEHAPQLLQSLQLLFKLHPRVAEAMLERISREMLALLKGSMPYIKDAGGWKTVGTYTCFYGVPTALSLVHVLSSSLRAEEVLPRGFFTRVGRHVINRCASCWPPWRATRRRHPWGWRRCRWSWASPRT